MRKYIWLPVLTLLLGCAGTPDPQRMAGYLADAQDIAELGTVAALLANPSYRTPLEKTRDALATIESLPDDGTLTIDDLIIALSNLPLDELKSEKGQIYITSGRILVRRFAGWVNSPELDIAQSGAIQQFAAAMRRGVDAGLNQTPVPVPAPVVR